MIDNLLKIELPRANGLNRSKVLLYYRKESGEFELSDNVACGRCKGRFEERENCSEGVMKVDASGQEITVVEHEKYVNQFNGTQYAKGGRCDLMMFDGESRCKVVFCDLGCYADEYVVKKQVKAHQQVCDSLKRFLSKPCGKDFVNGFRDIVLIFGRRDPALNFDTISLRGRGNVEGNMQAFMTNPFSSSGYVVSPESVEGVRVKFVVVNYPEVYVW